MKLDDEEKAWIYKTAKEEGVPAQMVYDAILITANNISDGYVIDFLWERGGCDLVQWYKKGIEDGKKLTEGV